MKKNYWAYFIAVSILASSCGTTKKQVKSVAATSVEKQESGISADQENEFEYTFIEGLKQKMIGNQKAATSLFA